MSVYMVLFVFLSMGSTVYADCPRPTGREHMQLITDVAFPAPEGTSVTFTCEMGYVPKGVGTVTCSNGQWSSLKMICEIRSCGSAGEVLHGYVDYTEGTDFGATIRVICNEGYTPVPKNNLVYCGERGWDGRLSTCDPIKCYPPNEIANGYFSPKNPMYHHSEVVTYACNGEYILNGSRTLVCTNEVFTPAVPNCVLVNCNPPKVDYGTIVSGSLPPYKHLTSVTFGCNTGYKINGTSTVSCNINSQWSPALPNCTEIHCKAPEIPKAEVEGVAKDIYKHLETLVLKCTDGYNINGASKLTCSDHHKWSPALPECTLIECAAPKVQGGKLVGQTSSSYMYKESVKFECDSGHIMKGESTVTCGLNSQWSPKLPECTLIQCKAPEVKHGWLVEGSRPSYKYKDTVVFDCKSGELKGDSTVTCDLNSQWSPELPQCIISHSNGLVTGLIIMGVFIGIVAIGALIYFGVKKKTSSGKTYTGAPREAETLSLS